MSFGDLLGLLLFLVFIVLPAVARAQQRRGGAGGPVAGPRPGAPRAGGPAAGAPASAGPGRDAQRPPGSVLADRGDEAAPTGDDDLARRLAEARRRVQQAMEQRNAGPGAPSSRPAPATAPIRTVGGTSDPRARAARPLVAQNLDDGLMATPLQVAAMPSPPRAPRAGRNIRHDLRVEAPPVEVERMGAAPRGPSGTPALRLDASGVRDGFVWHQVLAAPRARRRLGGGPFPER